MAEGSGSKVAIGCCSGIAVVVCAAAMIGVIWGEKAWTFFRTAAEERSELNALVDQWEASLDDVAAMPHSISPERVGEFQRTQQTLDAAVPGFSLEATGLLDPLTDNAVEGEPEVSPQATGLLDVYGSGGDEIRIWIAETSQIFMEPAIEKIKKQIDDRFNFKSKTSFFINGKGSLSYSGSPPDEQGLMMNTDDRIFFVQSNDKSVDLQDFLVDYFEAGMRTDGVRRGGATPARSTDLEGESPKVDAELQ